MTATVLIIGRAGRLRDGLCTILRTFPGIMQVRAVNGFESAFEQLAFEFSSAVIIDGDERLEHTCPFLKRMLSSYNQTRYIVIANTLRQHAAPARCDAGTGGGCRALARLLDLGSIWYPDIPGHHS